MKLLVPLILLGYVLVILVYPIRSFGRFNTRELKYFEQFEYINETYITKGDTLILTGDSWLQYFTTEEGDYAPLYGWYLRTYDERTPEYVVIEDSALKINDEIKNNYNLFLEKYPTIAETIANTAEECKDYKQDFVILTVNSLNCED